MVSSIGQALVLTTYANAFLAGHEVSLEFRANPWFQYCDRLTFCLGPDRSRVLAESGDEWLRMLRDDGHLRAYLWPESLQDNFEKLNRLGFAGARWIAPVTCMREREIIWQGSAEIDRTLTTERQWHCIWGGFLRDSAFKSANATTNEAMDSLALALSQSISFGRRHRPDENWHGYFEKSLAVLSKFDIENASPATLAAFPPAIYPARSLQLVEAVEQGWVMGGMGWWNDWSSSDESIQDEFETVTHDLYESLAKCLYAACDVAL